MKGKILIIFVLISFAITLAGCGNEVEKSTMDSQKENEDTVTVGITTDKKTNSQDSENENNENQKESDNNLSFNNITDISEAWSALYSLNEEAINSYEMPIMELIQPGLCFVTGVQYDLFNKNNKDGRFEGELIMAGWPGFIEKNGSNLTFGYDTIRKEDGVSPNADAGDKLVENGSLDLAKKNYKTEKYTERAGVVIERDNAEFKGFDDGSMICMELYGRKYDLRGEEKPYSGAIYIKAGKDTYDFVIGVAASGTEYDSISFTDKGDMTKEEAISIFTEAGYTIDKSGGIKDGALYMD